MLRLNTIQVNLKLETWIVNKVSKLNYFNFLGTWISINHMSRIKVKDRMKI